MTRGKGAPRARFALLALRALCAGACILALLAGYACAQIVWMATDGGVYLNAFNGYADTAEQGVEAAEYPAVAFALSGYFSGARDTPQAEIAINGHPGLAFNAKELTHLADVKALLSGFRTAAWICGALVAALVPMIVLWDIRHRKRGAPFAKNMARADLAGFAAALALIALPALGAALDFNGAFLLMHRLLFTNDLWLMNPQTDLIISLMPETMFSYLGVQLLYRLAPALSALAVGLVTLLWQAFKPRKPGNNA